nr:PssD/Cps14F family polysaccharide biosynthesis glycosyltransferase [Providencia rettgeri]
MKRLAPNIISNIERFNIITLSDEKLAPEWSKLHVCTNEFRSKHSNLNVFSTLGFIRILKDVISLYKKNNIKACISTGPGLAIPAAIITKIYGGKVIHIETWSRFHSKSFTGRILYYIADVFYVQNKSLLKLYPNATYSGLLWKFSSPLVQLILIG